MTKHQCQAEGTEHKHSGAPFRDVLILISLHSSLFFPAPCGGVHAHSRICGAFTILWHSLSSKVRAV